MEVKQKDLLKALADAERTLEKMQKTKKADLDKIRSTYSKELSKVEKTATEKAELVKIKTKELFEMESLLLQEKKRAEEMEKSLAELKNQMQVLQSQVRKPEENNSAIQNQLTELLTTTRMAPIYEILSRLPAHTHPSYTMGSMLNTQLSHALSHIIQPQQPGLTGEILSAINSLRTEQGNVNSRIEALLDERHPSQQQQYQADLQNDLHSDQNQYDQQESQSQEQKFDDIITESVAPADVSIDALASSLETAIEERNGAPVSYQTNSLCITENGESTKSGEPYETLDEIIHNLSSKTTEESDQFQN